MEGEPLKPPLETIRDLAVGIGPRPSASEAEGRAAEYVAGRLRAAGFRVAIEEFAGLRTFSFAYGIFYSLFVAAALLAPAGPRAAFSLALLALAAIVAENGGTPVARRLLPRRPSRNVVGTKAPLGPAKQRVILACHLDSARAALLWHPCLASGFRRSFLLMLAAMLAIVLVTAVLAFRPFPFALPLPPVALSLLLWASAGYLLVTVLAMVHRETCMPHAAGAGDNASGIAAALAAAETVGPLRNTELWVLATGCEESGLVGMAHFWKTHRPDPATTRVLNLDNCGAGRVAFTTSEGMLWRRSCDARLVAAAERAAAAAPKLDAAGRPFHTMNNDSFLALRAGCPALSIMAFDKRGLLPHWHWPTDTLENIDPATPACAAALAARMVRLLDEQA